MDEKIIDRIRKVKALADAGTEGEAANAASGLARMLHKYNLTMVDLEMPEEAMIEQFVAYGQQTKAVWKTRLASTIAKVTFCKVILSGTNLHFIGRQSDLEVAVYLTQTLLSKIEGMAFTKTHEYVEEFKSLWGYSPLRISGSRHPKSWRTSWVLGATVTVQASLLLQMKTFKEADGGSALIVHKMADVDNFVTEKYPDLGKYSQPASLVNGDAYRQGQRDGSTIHANRAMTAKGESALRLKSG